MTCLLYLLKQLTDCDTEALIQDILLLPSLNWLTTAFIICYEGKINRIICESLSLTKCQLDNIQRDILKMPNWNFLRILCCLCLYQIWDDGKPIEAQCASQTLKTTNRGGWRNLEDQNLGKRFLLGVSLGVFSSLVADETPDCRKGFARLICNDWKK